MEKRKSRKSYTFYTTITIIAIIIVTILIITQIVSRMDEKKHKNLLVSNSLYLVEKAQKILDNELKNNGININEETEYIAINIESDKLIGYIAVIIIKDFKTNEVKYQYHPMTTDGEFKICGANSNKLNINSVESGDCCKNDKENLQIEEKNYKIGYQIELKD